MPDSSSVLGIGSGLARGLATVLFGKRQQDMATKSRQEERNAQLQISLLPEVLKRAASYDDVQPYIDRIMGNEKGTKVKKGDPDHHNILSTLLGPLFKKNTTTAPKEAVPTTGASGTLTASAPQLGPMENGELPSSTFAQPTVRPEQKRQTIMGVPVLSNEEMQAREVAGVEASTMAEEGAKLRAKTKQAALLMELDPSMSMDDALYAVGLKLPQDQYATYSAGGGIYKKSGADAGTIVEPASAKVANLPAALRERVEEVLSRPDFTGDEKAARTIAEQEIRTERVADDKLKSDTAASLSENRDLRNVLLRLTTNAGGLTPAQVVNDTNDLRQQWQTLIKPVVERQEAVAKMSSALSALKQGNRLAAADQILVAFQKLNDEGNAVREGEVRRLMDGLGLPSRIHGALQRLQKDGAGIPDDQLRGLAKLATDTAAEMDKVRGEELANFREGVEESIRPHNIAPTRIFGQSKLGVRAKDTPEGAKRSRARQALVSAGKQADDATIDLFLKNNPNFK